MNPGICLAPPTYPVSAGHSAFDLKIKLRFPPLSTSLTEPSPQPLILESTYCVSGATRCAAENNTGRYPVAIIQLTLCRKCKRLTTDADGYADKVMDCKGPESSSGLCGPLSLPYGTIRDWSPASPHHQSSMKGRRSRGIDLPPRHLHRWQSWHNHT